MRSFLAPFVLAAGLLAALPAAAHDEMEVAGQVTAITAKTVQIKTASGQVVTLDTDSSTRVMMSGKRLTLKDLKVGQSVKALGFGDSMADLQAIDVVIVPAKPAKGG